MQAVTANKNKTAANQKRFASQSKSERENNWAYKRY